MEKMVDALPQRAMDKNLKLNDILRPQHFVLIIENTGVWFRPLCAFSLQKHVPLHINYDVSA